MEIIKNKIDEVQVQFTVNDGEWSYQDILVFSPADFELLTDEDIDKRIEERYAIWKVYVTTPIKPATKVENEAELAKLLKEKAELDDKITLLSLKVKNK